MQGAFCRAPNGGGEVSSAIGDGGLIAMDRAHGRAPWASLRYFKKATVPGRAWEWAAQSICEWARRSVREWAKTAVSDATQKAPTPIAS